MPLQLPSWIISTSRVLVYDSLTDYVRARALFCCARVVVLVLCWLLCAVVLTVGAQGRGVLEALYAFLWIYFVRRQVMIARWFYSPVWLYFTEFMNIFEARAARARGVGCDARWSARGGPRVPQVVLLFSQLMMGVFWVM